MTTIANICTFLGIEGGDTAHLFKVTGVAPLDKAGPTDMTFRVPGNETPTQSRLVLTRYQFAKAAWEFFPPGAPRIRVAGFELDRPPEFQLNLLGNIMPTAVIAAEPFANEKGIRMPSWAGVTIGKNVWVGHNSTVDRGMFDDTVIEDDTKIDNLVVIGHNAHVGKRCVVTAAAVVGGSSTIGDDTFIGLNATIRDHVRVGKNVTVGMGAVVLRDVPDGAKVVGNPARVLGR